MMAAQPTAAMHMPPLVRDVSTDSLMTTMSTSLVESWGSGEATPATSPPSSRGESPERKAEHLDGAHRHARSDTITALPSVPSVKNICFVGAGFVGKSNISQPSRSVLHTYTTIAGGPTAALIAYHNPSITVNVVDLNSERIAAWNSNHLPIHETGLPKIVRIARDGTQEATVTGLSAGGKGAPSSSIHLPSRSPNLFFSTNVVPCIATADIIFICVNTPTKMYGVGAGASADLGALESATRTIAKNAKSGAVIVEKSTVPCGTARIISNIVSSALPESHIRWIYPALVSAPNPLLPHKQRGTENRELHMYIHTFPLPPCPPKDGLSQMSWKTKSPPSNHNCLG